MIKFIYLLVKLSIIKQIMTTIYIYNLYYFYIHNQDNLILWVLIINIESYYLSGDLNYKCGGTVIIYVSLIR